jgi:hypothetical protein
MPEVVIALTDRSWRRLVQHAFAVAGWSTEVTHSPVDALAMAFNCEADLIVTGSDAMALELLRDLEKDSVLSITPCALITSGTTPPPDTILESLTVFRQPCDPYWIVHHADSHLGRETPAGLGRRPFSDDDCDLMLHQWWWSLAAADLIRQAFELVETDSGEDIGTVIAERLGRRVGAVAVTREKCEGDAPYKLGGGYCWRIELEEPLSAPTCACIDAVVGAVRACSQLQR